MNIINEFKADALKIVVRFTRDSKVCDFTTLNNRDDIKNKWLDINTRYKKACRELFDLYDEIYYADDISYADLDTIAVLYNEYVEDIDDMYYSAERRLNVFLALCTR